MSEHLLNKRNVIILAFLLIVIIFLILPVSFPFSITVTGKVVPGHQWVLMRQTDGSIMSTLYDFAGDKTKSYAVFQVDRGDIFHFKIHPDLKNQRVIFSGDTVGYLFSNMLYQEINRLEGALKLATANLDVVSSGEKETIISEARDQFLRNRERSQVQNKILERQTKLYQDSLISREDYEITRGMTRIYELDTQVAEAHLKTLQTGEKPEILAQTQIQIEAAETELQVLYNRLSEFTLTTPVTGTCHMLSTPDTLLLVTDDVRIVMMPVPWQFVNEVDTNHTFSTQPVFSGAEIDGTIIKKSDFMRVIDGQQVFIVTGIIDNEMSDLPINMLVQCSISGIRRTIWDYISDFLSALI